jgi:putative FmdB family regulatory protein
MPTYEYKCEACGHAFEQFQSITAAAIKKCPACGRMQVKRLISAGGGLIFKGSGFYTTDYRSESYKKAAQAEQAPACPAAKECGSKDCPKKAKG